MTRRYAVLLAAGHGRLEALTAGYQAAFAFGAAAAILAAALTVVRLRSTAAIAASGEAQPAVA